MNVYTVSFLSVSVYPPVTAASVAYRPSGAVNDPFVFFPNPTCWPSGYVTTIVWVLPDESLLPGLTVMSSSDDQAAPNAPVTRGSRLL